MEGVEPLGGDLDLLRMFHELGLAIAGLTHSRRNATGAGGAFAASGSPRERLTRFGRAVVAQSQGPGIRRTGAHQHAGFDDVLALATRPVKRILHGNRLRMLEERI